MWDKMKKYLGYAWASPLTIFGLTYAGLFTLLGWYRWMGVKDDALVWLVNNDKVPTWLSKTWKRWAGHAVGNVVVLKDMKAIILKHEQKHVAQMMRLGIIWPVVYFGSMLVIKWGCTSSDSYYDNPFEIDARRHAGQLIDIIGMKNKILEGKKTT